THTNERCARAKERAESLVPCHREIYFLTLTFQITFEPSSDTSSEPSRATVTPTGRPHASMAAPFSPLLTIMLLTKSSIGPGRPLAIGTNTTLYPAAAERFHDPWSATNAPLR